MKTATIRFRVIPQFKRRVARLAAARMQDESEIGRQALAEYVRREEAREEATHRRLGRGKGKGVA